MTAPGWQPQNETEQRMLEALQRDDQARFFREVATCELYLPAWTADQDRPEGGRLFVVELFGTPHGPVYTSVPGLIASVTDMVDGYQPTTYPELRRMWPPELPVALNPGMPIEAYLGVEDIAQAAMGYLTLPPAEEVLANERRSMLAVSRSVAEAVEGAFDSGDGREYLRALIYGEVVVPTDRPVAPEAILEPGFPWRIVRDDEGRPVIEMFTSLVTFTEAGADHEHTVTIPFIGVLLHWPQDVDRLVVDARTRVEISVPGKDVPLLALWTDEEPDDVSGGAPDEPSD